MARVIDANLPPVNIAPIERVDRIAGIALAVIPDKGESTGLSVFVLGNVDVSNVTILAEFAAQRLAVRAVREVVNLERDHSRNVGRRSTGHRVVT